MRRERGSGASGAQAAASRLTSDRKRADPLGPPFFVDSTRRLVRAPLLASYAFASIRRVRVDLLAAVVDLRRLAHVLQEHLDPLLAQLLQPRLSLRLFCAAHAALSATSRACRRATT